MNYFIIGDSSVDLAQSLRYDFVDGGQEDHPYFHVHLTDELIPEEDLRATGFAFNVSSSSNKCWVTTKIPTPDMTLASVIYCLVADHLGAIRFNQFAQSVRGIQDRLPPLRFERIKTSINLSSGHFKSSHWFSHMASPGEGEG